jgi:hypothetical protein
MIATISIVLCLTGILGASIAMFIIGNQTHNQSLTFGGIGPLFVFLLFFFMCLSAERGSRSMIEEIYYEEKQECFPKKTTSTPRTTAVIPETNIDIIDIKIIEVQPS